ncbi:MAG: type II and III secretion system protein [Bacteroidota bacterium]
MKVHILSRYISLFIAAFCGSAILFAQNSRLTELAAELDSLSIEIPSLNEETNISFSNIPLSSYIRAIGLEHQINVYIDNTPDLLLTSNLSQEPVKNVFLFICKNFNYTIDVIGTILEFKPYIPPVVAEETPPRKLPGITFENGLLAVDLKGDSLFEVVKIISNLSGKKILLPTGVTETIDAFLPPTPLDTALEAIFKTNGYVLRKKPKGYLVIEPIQGENSPNASASQQGSNDFSVQTFTDGEIKYVSIEAHEADLDLVVEELFTQLGTNHLLYDALDGKVTTKADYATLDAWLTHALKGTPYAFKKDEELYLVGKAESSWLQTLEIVKLKHRPTRQAMELIPGVSGITSSGTSEGNLTNTNRQLNNLQNNRPNGNLNNTNFRPNGFNNGFQNSFNSPFSNGLNGNLGAATPSAPPEISKATVGDVELVDYSELNRIILKGPADQVKEITEFLLEIDRPVPMIRIEMVVVEINKDRFLNTSLQAGLRRPGDSIPNNANILPGVDLSFDGAQINELLGSVPTLQPLGVLNQNFYLNLQAQETRGNLKIQMKPVLSMLNGREASLTIGQTQYFLLETTTSSNGAVNNFQQFTQRFESIVANVTLTVKPFVSDDGMVTLDVIPDFTTPVGSFDADVPPTIATRRFVSTIRVKNQETVVLGGLTEDAIGENTSGLPWVSRVPVLKWIFGNVQKTRNKSSLIIYITPVVTYY